MKSYKNLLEQLKSLPYFSRDTVQHLGRQLGLTHASVGTYISRFLRRKEVYRLKRGLYISVDFFDKHKGDFSYPFYLANIIRKPSYVTSWAALQYYNLTTESICTITSITPKVTREYKTKAGNFTYQSIKKSLFSDFILVNEAGKFDFFIASPAKALFDLLYFKTSQLRGIPFDKIKVLIEGLRLDIDEMKEKEQDKFYTMIRKHLNNE